MPSRSSNRFDNHRDSLPAADARAGDAIARPPPTQFQQQAEYQPRSGGGQRMTQGDRAAIHIGFIAIQPQLFFHRQILRRECFIHFHQIHLFEFQSRKR